jgi:hypothetical protein
VKEVYTGDKVQRHASAYASHNFEVRVLFASHNGYEYPAIVVSGGILAPVACKSDLRDPADPNKYLLKESDIYVRTLNAKRTVSSAKATWRDLDALVDLCASNRAADSVGFFTRLFQNLGGGEMNQILTNLSKLSENAINTIEGIAQLHVRGEHRFHILAEEYRIPPIAGRGFLDVVLIIQERAFKNGKPTSIFGQRFKSLIRTLGGFPP